MKKIIGILATAAFAASLCGCAAAQSGPFTSWSQVVTWNGASSATAAGISDVVRNIGQNSSIFQVCANASVTSDSLTIVGSFGSSLTVGQIVISPTFSVSAGSCSTVQVGGYYPNIGLNLVSLAGTGAAITANYSASQAAASASSLAPGTFGQWSQAVTWGGIPSTSANGLSDPVRNIGQASSIFQVCASAGVTTNSISIAASFGTSLSSNTATVSPAFSVAPGACRTIQVPGYYPLLGVQLANLGGVSPSITASYSGTQGTTPNEQIVADPCLNPQAEKSSAEIIVTAAGDSQLVQEAGAERIFVCGFSFTAGGTSPTVQFYLSGASLCGAPSTLLSGAYAPAAGQPVSSPPGGTQFIVPEQQPLCIEVGGTSPSIQGYVTYVTQ